MSAKFHHSTILKNFTDPALRLPQSLTRRSGRAALPNGLVETKLTKCPILSQFLNKNFCIFKNIQIFVI
jgi:hypothetical protein